MVCSNPLDTRDNTSSGSRSCAVENLDGDKADLLGNTIGLTSNSTGAVSTVSILVSVLILISSVNYDFFLKYLQLSQ